MLLFPCSPLSLYLPLCPHETLMQAKIQQYLSSGTHHLWVERWQLWKNGRNVQWKDAEKEVKWHHTDYARAAYEKQVFAKNAFKIL